MNDLHHFQLIKLVLTDHPPGVLAVAAGANRNHIIRATLEAIAYQSKDVLDAMQQDAGIALHQLRVDGGASAREFLMQFQADILGVDVVRSAITETTAAGAACLAGLAVGFRDSVDVFKQKACEATLFSAQMPGTKAEQLHKGCQKTLKRALAWNNDE